MNTAFYPTGVTRHAEYGWSGTGALLLVADDPAEAGYLYPPGETVVPLTGDSLPLGNWRAKSVAGGADGFALVVDVLEGGDITATDGPKLVHLDDEGTRRWQVDLDFGEGSGDGFEVTFVTEDLIKVTNDVYDTDEFVAQYYNAADGTMAASVPPWAENVGVPWDVNYTGSGVAAPVWTGSDEDRTWNFSDRNGDAITDFTDSTTSGAANDAWQASVIDTGTGAFDTLQASRRDGIDEVQLQVKRSVDSIYLCGDLAYLKEGNTISILDLSKKGEVVSARSEGFDPNIKLHAVLPGLVLLTAEGPDDDEDYFFTLHAPQ